MNDIFKFFSEKDKFAKHCGIELMEVSDGKAIVKMTIGKHHLNGVGTVHGGALFTIADFAFAVASNSHGQIAMSINASMNYFKAVLDGTLTAEAKEISLSPKLATYTVEITNQDKELIALFQGMVYRKKQTLETISQ